MRIAIHPRLPDEHRHPHLHHHILWALLVILVMWFLWSELVAGAVNVGLSA